MNLRKGSVMEQKSAKLSSLESSPTNLGQQLPPQQTGKNYSRIAEERRSRSPKVVPINLPTNGLIPSYPEKLAASTMTVADMKKLISEPDRLYYGTLIDIISELIGFDAKQLTVSDFDYTVISVRVNSVSPMCSFIVTCTECKKVFTAMVDFQKLIPVTLKEDYKEPISIKTSFGQVDLRLPRVADNISVIEEGDDIIARCAAAIADGTSLEKRIKRLENEASIDDIGLIRTFLSLYEHGISRFQTSRCSACEEEVLFWIPFRSDILFGLGSEAEAHFRKAIL
jgi:hypothetical protein